MKKTDLVEIIRTVVKEEIEKSLPQYLMEVLAERLVNNKPLIESNQQSTQKPQAVAKNPVSVSLESSLKQPPAQAPKMFSSNPILNQVLNETMGGIPSEQEAEVHSTIDVIKSLPKEVLNENKEVAAVATALTRDYSQLLKAAEAKAKSKRP